MLIIILFLISGSFGVSMEPGPCPNVSVVEMNLSKMTGKWHVYASTKNSFSGYQKCIIHNWFPLNNDVASMIATSISSKTGNHLKNENQGFVNHKDLSLHVTGIGPLFGSVTGVFWAFETVYDSHIIALTCKNQEANHIKSVIIFTREKHPSANVMEITRQLAAKNNISVFDLKKMNNEDCY